MEPGSPEWIEKTVEELEYLENARESLANATLGGRTLPNELAREVQLAAFDQRIAALFSQLEPYAADEEDETEAPSMEAAPALSTGLPVAGSSSSPQPVVQETQPSLGGFGDDPFADVPGLGSAPQPASGLSQQGSGGLSSGLASDLASKLDDEGDANLDLAATPNFGNDPFDDIPAATPQAPMFGNSGSFGSGLGQEYGDDLDSAGQGAKKKWVLPAALGVVAVAAGALLIPMLSSGDTAQADPTLSQPAAAAIAPAATPTPVPEPEPVKAAPEPEPEPEPVQEAKPEEVKEEAPAGDEIDPAILKERSPRGRRARRMARMKKQREARRQRREAAAEKRRNRKNRKKPRRPGSKRKKSEAATESEAPAKKPRKRKRLDLDNSGDPLG